MTTPDIEQLAKECINVAVISRENLLEGHAQIVGMIERAIAPLQQENERLHTFIDQASRVGYGTAVTLAIEAIEKKQQRAESELAELRKDRERLNWLQRVLREEIKPPQNYDENLIKLSIRDAIDEAMKGNP